ncbi:MAG: pseudouridine-5'-phosphate glycosidase [Geminicoccaceae bacterium]
MSIDVGPAVGDALAAGRPVVALESTLLCHGIPVPRNRELAAEIEDAVRATGAVPATVAVIDGRIKAGLRPAELERLLAVPEVAKCSTRDLPRVVASGALGATTVAATAFVAARVGIRIMATGGLGGVHQGGERTLDVSADLAELARTPVTVVCSGIKSILDQARTLERLETLGVAVVGYRCDELPGFYTAETGLSVPRLDQIDDLRRLHEAHRALGLAGMVVVQPPPERSAMPRATVERLVEGARMAARARRIRGPAYTPFTLQHMAEHSRGATVRVNCDLALANARLAAALAAALADGPEAAGRLERA